MVVRLLHDWQADLGQISICFAGHELLPAKTQGFVDIVVEAFRRQDLARRFQAG